MQLFHDDLDAGPDEPEPNLTADEAEAEAFRVASALASELDQVVVPTTDASSWLPERLSFLLARENYARFVDAVRDGHDILAGALARALFEEALRWSWVDEDPGERRMAFLSAAVHRYGQVDEAVRKLGVDPEKYYGPLVGQVLAGARGAVRFPGVRDLLNWAFPGVRDQLYAQYQLLSQYTHSSFLAAASAAEELDGQLVIGRLPQVARMTVLRNAVASMAHVVAACEGAVECEVVESVPVALSFVAMGYAAQVAKLLQDFAPATD